jgi:CRP-like cAMP-binding protein
MTELEVYINTYFKTDAGVSEKLATLFESETLSKNKFHTKLGAYQCKLSFVKSGFLRIYRQTESKEVTQWISSAGEFTTDLNALLYDQPARWDIQALTDCELYSLSFENYQCIPNIIPEWPALEKMFLGKCFVTIEERVFSFLSLTAEERYQMLLRLKPELFQYVPQQFIASMLGMTPETFSRIRKKSIS